MRDRGVFPSTHWSVVHSLACESQRSHALGLLFETYRFPVYEYVRRRVGSPERAEDLAQAFFTHVLERRAFERADRRRGRFRSFLLTSLKNFVSNEMSRDHALRRGGGVVTVGLANGTEPRGHGAAEPFHSLTPEALFNVRWALCQLQRVLNSLRRDFERRGKSDWFDELKPYLIPTRSISYSSVAETLNSSEGAVRVAVHRLRKQFRQLLVAEIARGVSDPAEVDDEIRFLIRILSAAGSTSWSPSYGVKRQCR
jgi:DNA-directed RNA polymerase specialized sigma24 family protein